MTTYREGEEFQHSNLSHLMLARSYLETFLEITPEVGEIEFHDNFSVRKWYQNPDDMIKKHLTSLIIISGKLMLNTRKELWIFMIL